MLPQHKRKWFILLFLCMALLTQVSKSEAAFLYQLKILDDAAISKLSDDELIQTYIDMLVELEATKLFHIRAGFSASKDFEQYKELLRYRISLRLEIEARKLTLPRSLKEDDVF